MKHSTYLIAISLLISIGSYAQFAGQNYIVQQTVLDSLDQHSVTTVDYYDGTGLKVQSVRNCIVPGDANQSLLVRTAYDSSGREWQSYLPVAVQGLDYQSDILFKYADQRALSVKTYDALDRLVKASTPGSDMAGRSKLYAYGTNVIGPGSVNKYVVEGRSVSQDGSYSPGTLKCKKTTDEDGNATEVYTDLFGQKLLERRILGANSKADTYYVYNDCGCLCFILQPMYQENPDVEKYAFRYHYDDRGRMIEKIIPGCDTIKYTYDDADRLLSIQDGEMRLQSKSMCYTYDTFSRQKTQTLNCGSIVIGTLQRLYYDGDYSFINDDTVPLTNEARALLAYSNAMGATSGTISQLGNTFTCGSIQKASDGTDIVSATYYNSKGQVVEKNVKLLGNHLRREQFTYTFTGQPLVHTTIDYDGASEVFRSVVSNSYDPTTGILAYMDVTTSQNGEGEVTKRTSGYEYDNYGRVSNETHGSVHQSKSYNVRDWPTQLASSNFSETLSYTTGRSRNGNINSIRYTGPCYDYTYQFDYDKLDRLVRAQYNNFWEPEEWWADSEFTEQASYDLNGNVTDILRIGYPDEGEYPYLIDVLKLSYVGNQMAKVVDSENDPTYMTTENFIQNSTDSVQYTYNANGSMVTDANKGIVFVEYDIFGYPKSVYFSNGNIIDYVYTPDGQKLQATYTTSVRFMNKPMGSSFHLSSNEIRNIATTDYWGADIVCKNSVPDMFLFDGGYADVRNNGLSWHYYVKDHLGSNRIVQGETGGVEATYNYYPFGAQVKHFEEIYVSNRVSQPYRFNGKEYDPVHGLALYDYGARMYDPLLARWTAIDPLAEKTPHISPYAYCENNPVKFVDPDGKALNLVAGAMGSVGGSVVNRFGEKAVETIRANTRNTIANARNVAYSIVQQTGAKMGGKFAKQQVGRETRKIIAEAKTSQTSATQTTQSIIVGKNWTVQMGIGGAVDKVSDYYNSAKKVVKNLWKKIV